MMGGGASIRGGKNIMPLAFLQEGEEAKIVDYVDGRQLTQRVVEMGLHRNEVVKMIKSLGGPVMVQVHDSKIALGHGVAMKILVEKDD
jgi:ferrous iron transport protein A